MSVKGYMRLAPLVFLLLFIIVPTTRSSLSRAKRRTLTVFIVTLALQIVLGVIISAILNRNLGELRAFEHFIAVSSFRVVQFSILTVMYDGRLLFNLQHLRTSHSGRWLSRMGSNFPALRYPAAPSEPRNDNHDGRR